MCSVIGCRRDGSVNFGELCSAHWGEVQAFVKKEFPKHKVIDLQTIFSSMKETLSLDVGDSEEWLDKRSKEIKEKVKRFTSLIIELSKDIELIYEQNKDIELHDEILEMVSALDKSQQMVSKCYKLASDRKVMRG